MGQWKTVEQGKVPTTVGLRLEIPKIDPEILNDPSRLDDVVGLKMAGVSQIQKGISDASEWLASVVIWLALCQSGPENSPEEKARKAMKYRISKAEVAKDQEKVKAYIDECLKEEEPIYKTAAAIAYLNYQFGREFGDHQEAAEMLSDLEAKKLLVKAPKGPILIGYQRYDVSSEFGLEQPDLEQVQKAVEKFSRSFMQFTRQQRQEKIKDLTAESKLTLKQFLDGSQGKFLLAVPAENLGPDLNNPGKDKWLGGGYVLLEVIGRDVRVIDVTGSAERQVQTMMDLDVRLPHHTLKWNTPPGWGKPKEGEEGPFQRVVRGVMDSRGLSEMKAETYVKKMQSFWFMVTRGIDAQRHKEEMDKLREFFRENAKITAEEFFGLEDNQPKEGVAYLEFEGAFKNKNDVFHNVFFLIERSRENDKTFLEVLDAPEHVKELLGPLSLEGKLEEGENFMKLPSVLQRILSAICNKTDLIREVAKSN